MAVFGAWSAVAATNTFEVPSFRGQAGTTFDGWEEFSVAVGNPGNKGDLPTSSGNATLYQTAAGALVLGSRNLYNGTSASKFEIRYGGAEPVGQVVFQARSLGTELDYESVTLFAWAESLPGVRTELERTPSGGPPGTPGSGYSVTSEWSWDISSLNANNFAIVFDAKELNLSLDSATVDVKYVPEPGVLALSGLGLAVLLVLARRR